MPRPSSALRASVVRRVTGALCVALGLAGSAALAPPATAAVGDDVIAWVEVENGTLSGGPAFNSGDHSNYSGTGSYTFRETGMTSTMTVNAPVAGTYPVYIRYAAGPLGAGENVTRSMGLLTNGGNRQQVSYPMTSFADWEDWDFAEAEVTLQQGANTIAVTCDRSIDFCRLNFDAIQVGGTAPDPCPATPAGPGYTALFDGTLVSFDGWRKAAAGGFGRQTDCFIRSYGGRGAEWYTTSQTGPYTLELDWRRPASDRQSSVYVASGSRAGADPVGGFRIPIGTGTGNIVPTGGTTKTADAAAVTAAVKPVGQWNTYRLELSSSRLRVYLNDVLVNTLTGSGLATDGFVGLETNNSSVEFKQIQTRPDVVLGQLAAPAVRPVLADGETVNPAAESVLGNLVAESQRVATGADLALVSPTSLGADLTGDGGSPATVTYQEAAAVQPADALVTMELTGAQIRTALEQQWRTGSFLRLGTSAGLTSTYDVARAAGSRVTGVWLDGAPLSSGAAYTVVASAPLAAGGDEFAVLTAGTDRVTTASTARGALADLVATSDGALEPDTTQHAVGVSAPSGASYHAGGALDLDITSWAFPGQATPDTSVGVYLGEQRLGSALLDSTTPDDVFGEVGSAAVRLTLPAETPNGLAKVRLVGNKTGTAVEVPITVTKAGSTTSVAVPGPLAVRSGRGTVKVTVTAPGVTPTGEVEMYVAGALHSVVPLVAGVATLQVGPLPTVGAHAVEARYLGSSRTQPSAGTGALTARRATPKVTATVQPGKVVAKKTKAKLAVVVSAPGITPTGKVTVRVGTKTYTGAVRGGRATVALPRFAKAGTVRASVTYAGDTLAAPASTTVRITVRKAPKRS